MYIIRDTYTNVSIYVPDVIAFICLKKNTKNQKTNIKEYWCANKETGDEIIQLQFYIGYRW